MVILQLGSVKIGKETMKNESRKWKIILEEYCYVIFRVKTVSDDGAVLKSVH